MGIVQRTAYPKIVTGSPIELQRILNQTYDLINSQTERFYVISFSPLIGTSIAVGKSIAPPAIIDSQHAGVPVAAYMAVPTGTTLHGPLSIDLALNGGVMLPAPIQLSVGITSQKLTNFLHPEHSLKEFDQVELNCNAVNASDTTVLLQVQLLIKLQNQGKQS